MMVEIDPEKLFQLRKDAARYRWLRDASPPHIRVRIWQRITPPGVEQPDSALRSDVLDTVIDANMPAYPLSEVPR